MQKQNQTVSALTQAGSRIRRLAPHTLLAAVYLLVAAASFNGFYDRWGFREGEPQFNATLVLSGQAYRPYAYRVLGPWIANGIAEVTPTSLVKHVQQGAVVWLGRSRIGPDFLLKAPPDYFIKYHILYYLSFLEFLLGLFCLRWCCLSVSGEVAASVAPAIFALVFPVLESHGGYYYDLGEVLFLSAAVLFSIRGWIIPLAFLTVLATLNKESFVFFIPALAPLLSIRLGNKMAVIVAGGLFLLAGVTYAAVSREYSGNQGAPAIFQLFENIRFYANPVKLFGEEKVYGLAFPKAYGVVWIAFTLSLAYAGWRRFPARYKAHVLIVLPINLILFVLFASPGEMRNLSLTFVGWTMLTASALQTWLDSRTDAAQSLASATVP